MAKEAEQEHADIDTAELGKEFADISAKGQKVFARILESQIENMSGGASDPMGLARAYTEATMAMLTNPQALVQAQMQFWQDSMSLWQNTAAAMLGGETASPVIEPEKGDNRFRADQWKENQAFSFLKQAYLLGSRYIMSSVAAAQGLDRKTADKVEFFTRQFVDALSPTNFAATNPDVLEATVESGGQNLVKGLNNLLADLEENDGQLKIKMVDTSAFKLGENIATTPGKVVYQNDLMQLIQYEPATDKVYKRPLLIIPPWINKYYILDLRPKNSLIKWLVDEGFTVFVISWVNPDGSLAKKSFDDYMIQGPLDALGAIEQATGEKDANVIGYCLGGTLLAATLGYLAGEKAKPVKSATFFTSMIDFAEPGDLGVFIDEEQVSSLEKDMQEQGYLEGSSMANTFNLLRSNDLIWSFVINNYLLGKDPAAFDLLYWNSDSTRMPAAMHSFYLRKMYMENRLKDPCGISLAGREIDLSRVDVPAYFLSTHDDHIAPWKSTYMGARLFKGPVRFVLGGSGHIAGVVNPPAAEKYGFWTGGPTLPETADEWLARAEKHPGSWWLDWKKWVLRHGRAKTEARVPGDAGLKVIEDAPGSYVSVRLSA